MLIQIPTETEACYYYPKGYCVATTQAKFNMYIALLDTKRIQQAEVDLLLLNLENARQQGWQVNTHKSIKAFKNLEFRLIAGRKYASTSVAKLNHKAIKQLLKSYSFIKQYKKKDVKNAI